MATKPATSTPTKTDKPPAKVAAVGGDPKDAAKPASTASKAAVRPGAPKGSKSPEKPTPQGKGAVTKARRKKPAPSMARRFVRALMAPFRAAARLFVSDVKLQRDGKNLNVKLVSKEQKSAEVRRRSPLEKEAIELQAIRAELKILLDSHPATRKVMKHLVYVEGALATLGPKAMIEVPVEVLSAAVTQLETLVKNWSNRHLSELRSKMSVAVVDRSRNPFNGASGDKPSDFNTNSRLMIAEDGDVSHSMFMELERQYQGLVTPEALQATVGRHTDFAPTFAPTQTFERDDLVSAEASARLGLSAPVPPPVKTADRGELDLLRMDFDAKPGVPDFAPTQAFEPDDMQLQLAPMP